MAEILRTVLKTGLVAIALPLLATACTTTNNVSALTVEKEQGSSENISSLTRVVNQNPRSPEAYNVRGSAYGRAGQYSYALNDFNKAISLNNRFYQAYSNRALMYKSTGDLNRALSDYNRAISINSSYAEAYIGRAEVYELSLIHI